MPPRRIPILLIPVCYGVAIRLVKCTADGQQTRGRRRPPWAGCEMVCTPSREDKYISPSREVSHCIPDLLAWQKFLSIFPWKAIEDITLGIEHFDFVTVWTLDAVPTTLLPRKRHLPLRTVSQSAYIHSSLSSCSRRTSSLRQGLQDLDYKFDLNQFCVSLVCSHCDWFLRVHTNSSGKVVWMRIYNIMLKDSESDSI